MLELRSPTCYNCFVCLKKPSFSTEQFYHIYNRGVEKRNIFLEETDYFRFIHDLYELNDKNAVINLYRNVGVTISHSRDLLVEIVCYCLMPNHFHLILKQAQDGGITKFMQKLGIGYALYFNQKYDRVGGLFQGRFKAVLITNDEYLIHLSRYIHLNPVELIEKNWQGEGIKNLSKVRKFLEKYRWSSYQDYIGIKNFPSVISQEPIWWYFKDKEECKKFVEEFALDELSKIASIKLE